MMTKNKCSKLLIFWFLFLSCCQFGCVESKINIEKINCPGNLPVDLHNKSIYFFKSDSTGSELSIRTLDFSEINYYQNSRYIPFIDVSNDGQNIVFAQIAQTNDDRPFLLWHYGFMDGRERRIAGWDEDYSVISISNPEFFYDDKKILFSITWYMTGKTGIACVDIDGQNLYLFEPDIPLAAGPTLSPDGSKILVTCAGYDPQIRKPCFQLCLLDKNGKYIRHLSTEGDLRGRYFFTPDGNSVIFTEFDIGGFLGVIKKNKYRLSIVNMDSYEKTILLDWDAYIQGISDDGSTVIVLGRPNRKSDLGIYLINIDGTNLRHLTYFDEFLADWYADSSEY